MGDGLLLFTAEFPFGNGEPYLEDEIAYLAARFPSVVIVPRGTPGTRRSLPENVRVDGSLAALHGRRTAARTVLRLLRWRGTYEQIVRHAGALRRRGATRRVLEHAAGTLRVQQWLRRNQRRLAAETAVAYAYWLHTEAAALVRSRRFFPGIAVVARAHGFDLYHERTDPPIQPFQLATVMGIDRVFTVSDHGCRYLTARYPAATDRVETRRLGVPDPGFVTARSEDGRFRVVSCSAIRPVKRLERLVDALAILGRGHPNLRVEWDHLGDGESGAGIIARARSTLPATVRATFHGQLPRDRVLRYYRRHPVDVFVNVSESEGAPVSIMEALSFGIPVVAPAVGGIPEIVADGAGVLMSSAPAGSEVASALRAVRSEDRFRAADGRALWARRYSAPVNYARFAAELHGLRGRVPLEAR